MAAERACDTHTPQRPGAHGKQAIRQSRHSNGNPVCCRPSIIYTRRGAGIGRHPKVNLSRLRRITASFSSDRAPVVGNWGCVHVGIVTGHPGRSDRCQQHGLASKTSQPTRVTGTEDINTMSGGVPGAGKEILRTRTSSSRRALATAMRYRDRGSAAANPHRGRRGRRRRPL